MRFILALTSATVLFCATAPMALAANHHQLPPGNSGAGQYVEDIPGGGGNHPGGGGHSGGGGGSGGGSGGGGGSAGGGGTLSPATQQALSSQGSAGQATAN